MWQLYMIRCSDNSLYTGITNCLSRRLKEHATNGAASAKYLRGKGPSELVFTCTVGSRSNALRAESRLKRLSKIKKEHLATGRASLVDLNIL